MNKVTGFASPEVVRYCTVTPIANLTLLTVVFLIWKPSFDIFLMLALLNAVLLHSSL